MAFPIVFDDGVRLTETIRIRVPPDFRDRMKTAAQAEGVVPAEFARRAIAERLAQGDLERAGDRAAKRVREAAMPAASTPELSPYAAAPQEPSPAPAEGTHARPSRSRGAWARP